MELPPLRSALRVVLRTSYLAALGCTHIHNLHIERRIEAACRMFGYECPLICTPAELLQP